MKRLLISLAALIMVAFSGCSGCSRSGRRIDGSLKRTDSTVNRRDQSPPPKGPRTTVKMEKINGVYQIPIRIDDIPMYFIFDTGAGIVSISVTEASFLYKQGRLTREDIMGQGEFQDATGNITTGTIINLHSVQIGNRVLYDIQASVEDNQKAPLLLGQSALEKFGRISIDNVAKEIVFE